MHYKDATIAEIDSALELAWEAFLVYRRLGLVQRSTLMRGIARELESCGEGLIETAMRETHLPEARLRSERARTVFQLNSYAEACEKGDWLDARIDRAIPDRNPPRPDIRKMLVPIGPVVVFGSSNFPFAYSTAGGDTACALAAGCPVIVKAHPAHPETSTIVAGAIHRAVKACGLPEGIFSHLHGASFEVGRALVTHPLTRAVTFTGSYAGGKQLFDWGQQRKVPIPVFAEMGSVNPVFLFPEKLAGEATRIAEQYAASITLGVGQFCTNPGLIIGEDGPALQLFIHDLGKRIQQVHPAPMLHPGIVKAYKEKKGEALLQEGVHLVAESETGVQEGEGLPTVATVSGAAFLANPLLHQEVFGPYSLVIRCAGMEEMERVAKQLEGQLTCTLMATREDILSYPELVESIQLLCGRVILNGVPTGVEVCRSMQHGGPFPATTDSRFTAVGADGIRRFARPQAWQNWPESLLPDELKDSNPLGIWRMVNDQWQND